MTRHFEKEATFSELTMLFATIHSRQLIKRIAIAGVAIGFLAIVLQQARKRQTRRRRRYHVSPARKRQRQQVKTIYEMLGPYYFKRAFRMSYRSFWKLAALLQPYMRQRNLSKAWTNGPILPSVRLACALRYFAGGASYDIAIAFGIATSEVYESVWEIVDAIHNYPGFKLQFPESHEEQNLIAEGFWKKSEANFDCCIGAIDGILIWIHRPSKKCCREANCDAGKFFCGRKLKYGLNCQAICDADGRFLDFSIIFPGSTADCLAFEGMTLHRRLQEGLLAPGLTLFGDNAYLNSSYMATPYSGGALSFSKDAYNFYHSQLRIQIECAFGKFSQRWGLLRSALPKRVTVKKAVALVFALAKLHNFCIEQREAIEVLPAQDTSHIEQVGGVPLVPDAQTNVLVPRQLIGGGEHFDGFDRNERRRYQRRFNAIELPRERLHAIIVDSDLRRPQPRVQV